jgi:hypothetical protein
MGNVLTQDASVKCKAGVPPAPHGGTVTLPEQAFTPLLKVRGRQVLIAASLEWKLVPLSCGNNPNSQTKCTHVTSLTSTAGKLTVKGTPVVLDTSGGVTDGVPQGTIAATDPNLGPRPLLRAV